MAEPTIGLAHNHGLRPMHLERVTGLIEETVMKADGVGDVTLKAEVTQIDRRGIWILIHDKEYFLPHEQFPKFRQATVDQIHNLRLINGQELEWPDLSLRLSVESLGKPEHVPTLG